MSCSSPPEPRQDCADGIRQHIEGISRGALKDGGTNDLEQGGPPEEMAENFSGRWRQIVIPQTKPSMDQQRDWQRARDQQRVIKPVVEERNMHVRFDEPAIARVERASRHKQGVPHVPKPLHSNASMISPKP